MPDVNFIKLNRRITKWGWYSDANTFRVFMHILLSVNWKDGHFRGHEIKAGSVPSGYPSIASALGLTVQNVRTAIKHLKNTGELTVNVTNKFSIITLVNWDKYQVKGKSNSQANSQPTVNQQAANSQLTPIEEGKKGRREESKNKSASINYDSFPSLPKKQLLDDWLQVRKTKRAANTQTAIDGVGRELHKAVNAGYGVDACFQIMAEQSWAGFRFKWLENVQTDIVQSQPKDKKYAKPATWED